MKVIVDTTGMAKADFPSFVITDTIKSVVDMVGVDTLIIHTTNEDDTDVSMAMLTLPPTIDRLYYVINPANVRESIKVSTIGKGGKYIDDDFYLSSEADLHAMLMMGKDLVLQQQGLTSVDILTEFKNDRIAKLNIPTGYKRTLEGATNDIIEAFVEKEKSIQRLSEASVKTMVALKDKIRLSAQLNETARKELEEYQKEVEKKLLAVSETPRGSRGSALFFPQVTYRKTKPIIRVKEIGTVSYLTSYMLGLFEYASTAKKLTPKIVFLVPPGTQIENLYKEYTFITSANDRNGFLLSESIIFTNYPTSRVITQILEDNTKNAYIIVDRLKNSDKHILELRDGFVFTATNKQSVVDSNKVPKKRLITGNLAIQGALAVFKSNHRYPSRKADRERYYLSEYKEGYEEILKEIK